MVGWLVGVGMGLRVPARSHTFRNSLVLAAWKAVAAMANSSSLPVMVHTNILNLAMAIVKGQALDVGPVGTRWWLSPLMFDR
jgi:hypothetical protein